MKVNQSILFGCIITTLGFLYNSVKAQCDTSKKHQAIAVVCMNASGVIIAYGANCEIGTNECIDVPCPSE